MGLERAAPLPPLRPIVRTIQHRIPSPLLPEHTGGPARAKIEAHGEWVREQALRIGANAKEIWKGLAQERDCDVSYTSVRRYLRDYVDPDTALNGLDEVAAARFYETLIRLHPAEAIYRIARFLKHSEGPEPPSGRPMAIPRRGESGRNAERLQNKERLEWMARALRGRVDAGELTTILGDGNSQRESLWTWPGDHDAGATLPSRWRQVAAISRTPQSRHSSELHARPCGGTSPCFMKRASTGHRRGGRAESLWRGTKISNEPSSRPCTRPRVSMV